MTSFWKQLVICAVLIAGAALSWQNREGLMNLWRASAAPAPQRQAQADGIPVIAAQTTSVQDDRSLSTIGTGFAFRSITLRAPASGAITEFNIAPGRNFAQGDILMRLEDADERFAVSLAQARLNQASDERDRFSRLQGSGVASASRLEEVQTNFQVAKIEFERAEEDLSNRVLRAPFDGITGLASVEIGDRIATDDTIGNYDDRSSILVEFDLPEALLSRVSIGLGVTARTPSVEGRSFEGQISAIDSRINPTTRTARVRVAIDNTADLLRPGASFALQLDLPGDTFPAVPELALQFADGALKVWRVTESVTEQVEVRLVRRRGGLVIVDGPLSEGDLVVVEGTQRLRSGTKVNVLNAPEGPST
ncbi:Multidrug efflux pump, membrane fusion protein (MFP) family [Sulfitobacter noctilucae]|uniref:efflux RND transporter periplasmic adaptor subunit n=1 Tax=Sulfitobacter noctilucae TaxID=1342302 RepID=UPI00046AA553|nr:efflux RND transporter periplasmic adaptor subunit [Sulfitobacter noctilucae]KIN61782.1 Multidrug efflux pump, membrane fusion protein (MFP) family [Sulfitobacter noctilucae]